MTRTIIGIDVGGTKTAVVEGTFRAEILQRREMATLASEPFAQTFDRISGLIDLILSEARREGRDVSAISVSIGGPLKISEGEILDPPHLPGWHNVPLKAQLEQRYPGLPVYVEHDGNAGALAEFHFGSGVGLPDSGHLVFITFGTGLGAGLVINGAIVHGASDTAGEVGHWRMARSGPTGFGKEGSWEGFSSGKGLLDLARSRFPDRWTDEATIQDVVEAALANDPAALALVAEIATWLGRGIALLIDALNPHVVALGALSAVLGDRLFVPLQHEVEREALPQAVAACKIIPAQLGPAIGDVASLMAAITAASKA